LVSVNSVRGQSYRKLVKEELTIGKERRLVRGAVDSPL